MLVRVAILYNPRAGRGLGAGVAQRFEEAISRAGHATRQLDVTASGDAARAAIEWCEAVVLVGGDGTLHHTLPSLLEHRRPLFQAAMGTENLFAREFGHTPTPEAFLNALRKGAVRRIDLGMLERHGCSAPRIPFAILASLGPDSSIVHRVAARRSGPIRRGSYAIPMLRELFSPRIPTLTIEVDGHPFVTRQPGMLALVNVRQYALRLDPAFDADPGDGLLDVVFLPGRSLPTICMRLLAHREGARTSVRRDRGSTIKICVEPTGTHEAGCLPEADGEAVMRPVPATHPDKLTGTGALLVVRVRPQALDVLVI